MHSVAVVSTFLLFLTTVAIASGSLPAGQEEVSAYLWAFPAGGRNTHDSKDWNFVFQEIRNAKLDHLNSSQVLVAATKTSERVNETGWITQTVSTNVDMGDLLQAYWAGYLETNQTRALTEAHYNNTLRWLCDEKPEKCISLYKWLEKNMRYMLDQVEDNKADPFWYQIYLILWQAKGMVDAYAGRYVANSSQLNDAYLRQLAQDSHNPVYLLSISADLGDLVAAVDGVEDEKARRLHRSRPSCSALVKVLAGTRDIYFAHDTWGGYEQMLRVAKYYDFSWHETEGSNETVKSRKMLFSSYPSVWTSIDDFYVLQSGLVTMETTNNLFNHSLYAIVRANSERSVLEVFRVMAANRLASSTQEWMGLFEKQNSGTYNNQWMVLDYNRFKPGKPLPDTGLFLVAEQIPGMIKGQDMSKHLQEAGYWASYNVAYFAEIRDASGYTQRERDNGTLYSHDECPRAEIFARDQARVNSLKDMYQQMRYNEFDVDPLSRCQCLPPYTAQFAIASRSDLNSPEGRYPFEEMTFRVHGAIDTKLTNSTMALNMSMIAVSSPTYETMPEFRWSRLAKPQTKPTFHPDVWKFAPYKFSVSLENTSMIMLPKPEFSLRAAELLVDLQQKSTAYKKVME